jgi:hypothetical protein
MENIIGKGISGRTYFNFVWSYFYFSFGYFFCKKICVPLFDEYDKLEFAAGRRFLPS